MLPKKRDSRQRVEMLPPDWVPMFREAEDFLLGTAIAFSDNELKPAYTIRHACLEMGITSTSPRTDPSRRRCSR